LRAAATFPLLEIVKECAEILVRLQETCADKRPIGDTLNTIGSKPTTHAPLVETKVERFIVLPRHVDGPFAVAHLRESVETNRHVDTPIVELAYIDRF